MQQLIQENKILWPSSPEGRPRRKKFLSELQSEFTGMSSLLREVPSTSAGTQEIRELFGVDVFDFPKPLDLLKILVRQASSEDDIVFDFFAGSCPTAHAVIETNLEDGGDRRFVMIQIPEPTAPDSPARQAGYPTIADIGKQRIRHVIERMQTLERDEKEDNPQLALDLDDTGNGEEPGAPPDLGFKVFKLAPSTFRRWEPPDEDDAAALEQQLSFFDAGLKDDADPQHTLYEVLLKEGYSLNSEIEPLAVLTITHK
jgi:adenine-specific DNA-methyltransferase